jgi:hypothetical protein
MPSRYAGMRKFEDTHTIGLPVADDADLEEGDVVEYGPDGLDLADGESERVFVVLKPEVEGSEDDKATVQAREGNAKVADGVGDGDYVEAADGEFDAVGEGSSDAIVLEEPEDGLASVLFG